MTRLVLVFCVFLGIAGIAAADEFFITVTNLEGGAPALPNTITVRAFKMTEESMTTPLVGSFTMRIDQGGEIGLVVDRPSDPTKPDQLVLHFIIDRNNPIVRTDSEKAIVLVFFRNTQQMTAIPSITLTNLSHNLTVAVPQPVGYSGKTVKGEVTPPQCEEPCPRGGLLRRLFGRCRR